MSLQMLKLYELGRYLMIYYINENIGYLKMALFGSEALFVRFLNCLQECY